MATSDDSPELGPYRRQRVQLRVAAIRALRNVLSRDGESPPL